MNPPIPVRVRDCECPGSPHAQPDPETGRDGDEVYVLPRPSLQLGLATEADSGIALQETFRAAGDPPKGGWSEADQKRLAIDMGGRLHRRLLETYIRYGAVGWNFEDESGPIPFDVEDVIGDFAIAQPVAEFCDELYGETVTRPLVQRAKALSEHGRTGNTTSRRPTPIRKPRKRSSPATTAASKRSAA